MTSPAATAAPRTAARVAPPMAMLAELTYRCPLKCPYCSNPLELAGRAAELSGEEWADVLRQGAAMGVLHVHFSGGEPAARRELEELVSVAAEAGLYSNLITSGVGLTEARVSELSARGLDHVQLSIQAPSAELCDRIGGYDGAFERKIAVAGWLRAEGLPLTVNAVVHRGNLDALEDTIELAVSLGARRLEVAHAQMHGWAYVNRAALLPTRAQVDRACAQVEAARERLQGVLVIDHVPPDHYARYPKACMGGWGRVGLNVTPTGKVLPCHAAETIPHLRFETVRDRPLREIWEASDAFNAYRGLDWMPEPCRSCPRKEADFGGCRCQALAYAGDAGATDPACVKSPHHGRMLEMAEAEAGSHAPDYVYREMRGRRATPRGGG